MPLTRSQVRIAFARARKHFKGKIPKGTKLARFVTGHHSSSTPGQRSTSRTTHHSRTSTAVRRVSHTVRRHPGLVTKAIKAGGGLIAFNQEIGQVASDLKSGALFSDPQGSLERLTYKFSGVDPTTGAINAQQTTASAVSKIAGFGFIKVAMWFKKNLRM